MRPRPAVPRYPSERTFDSTQNKGHLYTHPHLCEQNVMQTSSGKHARQSVIFHTVLDAVDALSNILEVGNPISLLSSEVPHNHGEPEMKGPNAGSHRMIRTKHSDRILLLWALVATVPFRA